MQWFREVDRTDLDRDRTRAVASQVAYDLGINPSGVAIAKRIADLGLPADVAGSESVIKHAHTWDGVLTGKRRFTKEIRRNVLPLISRSAIEIDEHVIWETLRTPITSWWDYSRMVDYLPTIIKHGHRAAGARDWSQKRPSQAILRSMQQANSLEAISFYVLLLGKSVYLGWDDLTDLALQRLILVLCREASVPPFARFGDKFAQHVLERTLGTDQPNRPSLADWHPKVTARLAAYKALLEEAYEAGLLLRDSHPQGDRWQELEVLRFSDEVGRATILAAISAKRLKSLPRTDCYLKLQQRLATVSAPANPWFAPSPYSRLLPPIDDTRRSVQRSSTVQSRPESVSSLNQNHRPVSSRTSVQLDQNLHMDNLAKTGRDSGKD